MTFKTDGPRQVIFDIGNVLFHFDPTPLLELLIGLKIVKDEQMGWSFLGGSFQHSQELGLHNIKQSFYQFNPDLSQATLDEIQSRWLKTFYPSPQMIDVVEELLGKGYSVALLSNIGPDHAFFVRENCKTLNRCIQHFSCDVGARKPTRLFFQSFLIHYGWGRDVKYFDDRQDNIDMGSDYHTGIVFDITKFSSDDAAAERLRSLIYNA
jgi:FMN phosphatase YigB (HAD superfamily)